MPDASLRERVDALLRDVGVDRAPGTLLEDARFLASAIGITFTSVKAVINQAEVALQGETSCATSDDDGPQPNSQEATIDETVQYLEELQRQDLEKEEATVMAEPVGDVESAPLPPRKKRRTRLDESQALVQDEHSNRGTPSFAPRSAFAIYSAGHRAEMVRQCQSDSVDDLEAAVSEGLMQAWNNLNPCEKEEYNACASVEKHMYALEKLRRGVRSPSHAPKIARIVKESIAIMGHAPKTARASGLFEGIISALEDLDRRLGPGVREKLGEHLGPGILSKDAQSLAKRVFGQLNGTRLLILLRRWCAPDMRKSTSAQPSPSPNKATTTLVSQSTGGPPDEETRHKVTRILGRAFQRSMSPRAATSLGNNIENELHELASGDAREYRSRARTLQFNLSATDGTLLERVVEGNVTPHELVRLPAEELASEQLKADREEERARYLSAEVVVTEAVPKRRDKFLLGPIRGRAAEREAAGPEEPDESQDLANAIETSAASLQTDAEMQMLTDAQADQPDALQDRGMEMGHVQVALQATAQPEPSKSSEINGQLTSDDWRKEEEEEEALFLLDEEDTSNDAAIAQLLELMPATPSSSSSSSDESDGMKRSASAAAASSSAAAASSSAAAVSRAASSSSSSLVPPASDSSAAVNAQELLSANVEKAVTMGFSRTDAERALGKTRGNLEEAISMLCEGMQ